VAFIKPNIILAGSSGVFDYTVIASGDGSINTLTLPIPAGWAVPITPASNIMGGAVSFTGNQIVVSYATP